MPAKADASMYRKTSRRNSRVRTSGPQPAVSGGNVAIEEGHSVNLFLAGDAVQLMRDAGLDNLSGLGTGKLREHYQAISAGGGRFYLSGMSSTGRGVSADGLEGKPAEMAMPNVLVRLTLEADATLTY